MYYRNLRFSVALIGLAFLTVMPPVLLPQTLAVILMEISVLILTMNSIIGVMAGTTAMVHSTGTSVTNTANNYFFR